MKRRLIKNFRLKLQITNKQKLYLLLTCALYFGVILGSITVGSSADIKNVLVGYAQSIYTMPASSYVFLNDFILYFAMFSGLFLLGMSVYGYFFIPIIPFIKGFSYGFLSAFYCHVFGSKGILIGAMCILPQLILSSICLVIGAYISIQKSLSFSKREYGRSFQRQDMRQYSLSFLVLFFVAYLTVFMDVFLTGNVINLFC